ncbi:ABC transporter permease [Aliikangiella sp. IMCC44632]
MNKFFAIFVARNKEFVRDRASLSWNFIFPILLLLGFSFMFSNDGRALYKIGVVKLPAQQAESTPSESASDFLNLKYFDFIHYDNRSDAILKVDQHKIDLLVDFNTQQYWVNETSSKGYIAEQLLLADNHQMQRSATSGKAIRYVDWVMPGILGMNMMFSCLFGVGYVIVRYRKNGVLKRFQATPLSALEFLSAQILSRLVIVMCVTSLLFVGSNFLLDFYIIGDILNLFIIALVGSISLIALSLVIASRSSSEEFTGGMLNFVSWPMMFLSGVWFSLEGSSELIQNLANIFPLTHILEAAREVMTDGAGLADISDHLLILFVMSAVFLSLGAMLFDWGSNRT